MEYSDGDTVYKENSKNHEVTVAHKTRSYYDEKSIHIMKFTFFTYVMATEMNSSFSL